MKECTELFWNARKQRLNEPFASTLFEIVRFFHKFYMILFYMVGTFYLSSLFPSITLINYVLSYHKMLSGPMNNARD